MTGGGFGIGYPAMTKTLIAYLSFLALGILAGTQQRQIDDLRAARDAQQEVLEAHQKVIINHHQTLQAVENVLKVIWEKVNKNFT